MVASAVAALTAPLAQVQLRDRSGGDAGCVADDGLCPGWIADNFDRYVDPLVQHVYLVLASVAIGFAISRYTLARLPNHVARPLVLTACAASAIALLTDVAFG